MSSFAFLSRTPALNRKICGVLKPSVFKLVGDEGLTLLISSDVGLGIIVPIPEKNR
jgi:hypothetical protein